MVQCEVCKKAHRAALILILVSFPVLTPQPSTAQEDGHPLPLPSKAQLAWQEAELGILFSYDLHVFDNEKYIQHKNRITPIPDYNIFNPEQLDTDQWIRSAKEMGARFALLTATHETGFALYPSDANPYCLKAVKWRDGKGDIVGEFVDSCRKHGIEPGIYLGIRWNAFLGVHNFKVVTEGTFGENRQAYYNRMMEGMVKEICTRYGELFEVWFDGGAYNPEKGAPDVLPIVKAHQPGALFYHNAQLAEVRWGGTESGTVAYPCWATFPFPSTDAELYPITTDLLRTGDPKGRHWMPAMSDAPLRGYKGRHEWFWEPGDEEHVYPLDHLMEMYYKSVGRNSTLILGITPDPAGRVPEPDRRRMKEFGDEVRRRFGKPVAATQGKGTEMVLDLGESAVVNHVIIMEDIVHGERVRAFVIEGLSGGEWVKLTEGSCVGHKRIDRFEDVELTKVRLQVLECRADPVIKELSLFHVME